MMPRLLPWMVGKSVTILNKTKEWQGVCVCARAHVFGGECCLKDGAVINLVNAFGAPVILGALGQGVQ